MSNDQCLDDINGAEDLALTDEMMEAHGPYIKGLPTELSQQLLVGEGKCSTGSPASGCEGCSGVKGQ